MRQPEYCTLPGGLELGWCLLEDRSGHEAGLELLEQLYRRRTGQPLPPIVRTDRGKPCFEGTPLHFSISHTPRHAFCVLGPVNMGLDAEEQDRPIRLALAEKILSSGEYQRVRAAQDPRRALLKLWVLKEAEVKRTGEGLRGYPNKTDFFPEDPRVLEIACCYVAVLTEGE